MVGSIERLRRHIQVHSFAPMMLLVIGVPGTPDPIAKRAGGTAGVIAIPATPASASATMNAHGEILPDTRRERTERGRVLYAPGHAPRDTVAASVRPVKKQTCVEQTAIRARGRNSTPTN